MKFVLLFLSIGFYSSLVLAQQSNKIYVAPVSKEYQEYLKSGKANKNFGVIPSPMNWNFSSKKTSYNLKELPESYDLRDLGLVTPVRNQGSYGACWSFGAMAALESNWLLNGYGTFDLSEENMATCHDFESSKEDGGNREMATAYLTRFDGPVSESDDPYSYNSVVCKGREFQRQAYITQARFLEQDAVAVKNAVIDYGAIPISVYWDDSHYNSSDYTYHYTGSQESNHTVTIVGWNDTIVTNGGTGAWIIKNSWGASWGENGYFYLSYQDKYSAYSPSYYPERKEIDEYDKVFMYDKFGAISSIGFSNEIAYVVIKFTAEESYRIDAIGMYVNSSNASIQIDLYESFNGSTLQNNLGSVTGTTNEPGYYSFDAPFVYVEGDFYVRVKYNTPDYVYPVPVESKELPDFCVPEIEGNVAWISPDGISWGKLGVGGIENGEVDLTIRAYGKVGWKAVSVNDGVKTRQFEVFPNPTNGNFYITLPGQFSQNKASIEIFDLTGKKCFNETIVGSNQGKYEVKIDGKLKKGMYLLRVSDNHEIYTSKLYVTQ